MKILCIGDSITYGTGSTPGNSYSKHVNFIDVYAAFKAGLEKGLELYDGIHPFDLGYEVIGSTIGKAVYETIKP